jgi:hypothetical protein
MAKLMLLYLLMSVIREALSPLSAIMSMVSQSGSGETIEVL